MLTHALKKGKKNSRVNLILQKNNSVIYLAMETGEWLETSKMRNSSPILSGVLCV